jgi:dTDP-4-amino-4,6-dideoxygalactose transaminase
MQIKYLDLQAQYQSIKPEISVAIQKVLDTSSYVLGPSVAEFESAFAEYCGSSHCVGVNNGTNALQLAIESLGIGRGDEVITAANTFIATAAAIAHSGATPVLVDIEAATRNIDPKQIEQAITPKTKAIMPVHLYGCMTDMEAISVIAKKHNLPVIEDCAQAHGARHKGKRAGSIGQLGGFSFYPGKNLGAYGEGGAVTTSDAALAKNIKMLRDHGSERKYYHDRLGYNARLEGIQGAVLGVKLKHLDKWNAERNRVARRYSERLQGLPILLPRVHPDFEQVFHLYVIESDSRNELQEFLSKSAVPTLIHYPVPIHLQPAFACLDYRGGAFPHTENSAQQALSLPIYPEMSNDQVDFVSDAIVRFFSGTE